MGVVTIAHNKPSCTCGWEGRKRLPPFAVHDALAHAYSNGCQPNVPLVVIK